MDVGSRVPLVHDLAFLGYLSMGCQHCKNKEESLRNFMDEVSGNAQCLLSNDNGQHSRYLLGLVMCHLFLMLVILD